MNRLQQLLLVGVTSVLLSILGSYSFASTNALLQGLGDLPGGGFLSRALAISADGQTVVGVSASQTGQEAFQWTPKEGISRLNGLPKENLMSIATAVSANGSVIVGFGVTPSERQGFRWTRKGVEILSMPDRKFNIEVYSVSANGSVVVGSVVDKEIGGEAFMWTPQQGVKSLGRTLCKATFCLSSGAKAISSNGFVVVGEDGYTPFRWVVQPGKLARNALAETQTGAASATSADGAVIVGTANKTAFRWQAETGMVNLGDLPGGETFSEATAVSADGAIVVGAGNSVSGTEAFIWDKQNGMRSLKSLLTSNKYKLNLGGWQLSAATGISADGLTIVGSGVNPTGQDEAWLVRLKR